MKHFSHKHPLSQIEVKVQLKKKLKDSTRCCGCFGTILSEEFAYFCIQDGCKVNFFLHKSCAELPLEISHPNHQQHSLILREKTASPDPVTLCSVCQKLWGGFTYSCLLCKFDVDVLCVLRDDSLLSTVARDREHTSVTLKCHEHPLMLNPRKALFYCNACGTEDTDQPYLCTTTGCSFWIHKSCAFLPEIKDTSHIHNHPLSLAYSFPLEYGRFHGLMICEFCGQNIYSGYWIYQCLGCRYFFHVKCANATTAQGSIDEEEENIGNKSIKFPGSDSFAISKIFMELTRYFLGKYCGAAQELLSEINHFSHMHPLKEMEYKEALICDGCILPICDSYYGCEKCSYFLHPSCAQLPREFQHPGHVEHPLALRKFKSSLSYIGCNFCKLICNGFLYSCEVCQFHLDLKCTILDIVSVIRHEAHPHKLERIQLHRDNYQRYNSCHKEPYDDYYSCDKFFGCKKCGNFFLDYECLFLPGHINPSNTFGGFKQDNDHPVILMYPPFSDHPDEFYCEICELEMHPKFWIYHCKECDRSFHSSCIVELHKYRNIKFGASLFVLTHRHALRFILRGGFNPLCQRCDEDLHCKMAFECEDCNYYLCYVCGLNSYLCHVCGINSQDLGLSMVGSPVDKLQLILAEDVDSVCEDEVVVQHSITLPADNFTLTVEQFLKHHGFTRSQLASEVSHFSHEHLLKLCTDRILNNEKTQECYGCARPISTPYYVCKEYCHYFLHAYCALLPDKIQLKSDPSKVLILSMRSYNCSRCNLCFSVHGGFFFTNGNISLDIHCAILRASSTLIKHEAHPHPLVLTNRSFHQLFQCNACGLFHNMALRCDDCGFNLHIFCALLPRVVSEVKIHKHPLILRCQQSASQCPKVIYCEYCKKKIYTIFWFYHCSECNQSFHHAVVTGNCRAFQFDLPY